MVDYTDRSRALAATIGLIDVSGRIQPDSIPYSGLRDITRVVSPTPLITTKLIAVRRVGWTCEIFIDLGLNNEYNLTSCVDDFLGYQIPPEYRPSGGAFDYAPVTILLGADESSVFGQVQLFTDGSLTAIADLDASTYSSGVAFGRANYTCFADDPGANWSGGLVG